MATTRMAAFVFCDLVGSTALQSRLGDEATHPVRRAVFDALQDAVVAHDGEEIKNLGDGTMSAFDSAADAVSAAVAMQQAILGLGAADRGLDLQLRVGVSAGEATWEEGDWFGTPVVEAARFCDRAGAGQILVSELAQSLAAGRRRHAFTPVGSLELKGLPAPVPAYEVAWEPAADTEGEAGAGRARAAPGPPPEPLRAAPQFGFVGRVAERDRLEGMWKEAVSGRRRVVMISGEAGIGKTSLAAELARTVDADGGLVLYGRCDEDLGLPYQPFVEVLRPLVLTTPVGTLRLWARAHGEAVRRLVPELAQRFPASAPTRPVDPETERFLLFQAVSTLLAVLSSRQPVLLVVDDLHWAARPTVLLLKHVVSSHQPMRLLTVGTFRETDVSRSHPLSDVLADLHRQPWAERMPLRGLGDNEVTALVERASGEVLDRHGVALAHAVGRESDGNPFFVGEILRHLAESGAVGDGDGGRWVSTPRLEEVGLPASIREVIGQRVHRLGEEARQVLSAAAVIGRDFDLDLLARVADVPETRLEDRLDEAIAAGVVAEVAGAGRPGRFTFAHALFQHALYQDLSVLRRARTHQRVAAALEDLCGADPGERVAELAHHSIAASRPINPAKVVAYATQAGDRALAQLAPEEAVRWYSMALELHRGGGEPGADVVTEMDLLIGLGEAERRAGHPAFRETLLEAAALAERRGDSDRLVRAALANNRGMMSAAGEVDEDRVAVLEAAVAALGERDVPERARVLATLAAELTYAGDWPRRRALADEAAAMARRLGDDATLARVLNVSYTPLQVPETLARRLADTAENLELTHRLGDPRERFSALDFRLRAVREAGRYEEVGDLLAEMQRLPDRLGQPVLLWYAGFHASCLAELAGRLEDSERIAVEALQIGNDSGQPEAIPIYAASLLSVRRDQGRLAEVVDLVAQQVEDCPGIPGFRAMLALCYCELDRPEDARPHFEMLAGNDFGDVPYDLIWSSTMAMLAEVCASLGDATAAAVLASKLEPLAGTMADNGISTFGAVDRYLGLIAATRGPGFFSEADRHFAAAAGIHQRIGAPIWLVRTQLDWARLLRRRGEPGDEERARELLTAAASTARDLGCAGLARAAEVELS